MHRAHVSQCSSCLRPGPREPPVEAMGPALACCRVVAFVFMGRLPNRANGGFMHLPKTGQEIFSLI